MERSNSAFSAAMRGEGFGAASGGIAKRRGIGAKIKMAPNAAHKQKRRAEKTGIERFKSASLTIRRNTQRFSVRHRPWGGKRWCSRREAAKPLHEIRWPKRRERRCGRAVRITVAHGGELPGFYGHANTREIADLHDAVKNNHRHNVVFIADVKIRADDARDARGSVYLELPAGLRNFLRLRADFPDRHFQVGLLRACVVLHDLHGGIRAHVEYRAVIKRNTRPAVGLGAQHILPVDRSFRAGVHGLRASHEADRRYDAANFSSALAGGIGECEGIKRNRQRAREQTNQCHWIRGFSSHRGLLDTNRTVTTLVTGEASGGQMKRGKALPS